MSTPAQPDPDNARFQTWQTGIRPRPLPGTRLSIPIVGLSQHAASNQSASASAQAQARTCPSAQGSQNTNSLEQYLGSTLTDLGSWQRLRTPVIPDSETTGRTSRLKTARRQQTPAQTPSTRPLTGHTLRSGENRDGKSASHQDGNAQSPIMLRVGLDPTTASKDKLYSHEFSRKGILLAYQQGLERFQGKRIDMLLLDGCAALPMSDLQNELHFTVAMQDGLQALQDLKAGGEIGGFGLASDHADYCQRALREAQWDFFVLNHRYTLLEQWPLFNLLPECEQSGTSVIIGQPFNSGVLCGRPFWNFAEPPNFIDARIDNIRHICRLHEVPVEAAALRFPLAHPMVRSVLLDPADHDCTQLYEWLTQPISTELWADLKLGGVLHEEAPVPAETLLRNLN